MLPELDFHVVARQQPDPIPYRRSRYMGQDRAEEFGRRNAVRGELLVRVTPERVIAEIMGWEEASVARIIRKYVDRSAAIKDVIRQLNEKRK